MHHVLVVLCGPLQAGQFASRLVQGRHHVLEGAAASAIRWWISGLARATSRFSFSGSVAAVVMRHLLIMDVVPAYRSS